MRLDEVLHLLPGKRDAQWQIRDERILHRRSGFDGRDLEREIGDVA